MAQTSKSEYKISFRKIHRAAMAEVRVHKKLTIITLVLYGVAMLLFLFNSEVYGVNGGHDPAAFYPSGWGIFFTIAGMAVGFFTALNIFRDMNNQQLCDVSMALPIKSSERFFSKILSLFLIQIFPLILSTLGGNGITLLIGTARFGALEERAIKTFFAIVLGALAGSLFIMGIAVLCSCCCGALAESAYFSIIMMVIINALPMAFVYIIISGSSGFLISSLEDIVDLGYIGVLFLLYGMENIIPHCLVSSAISLAIMLLSGFIYVKRDARSVGTPISSRVFFEVMMALACATVFSLFSMSSYVMWGVLISAVAYVIVNIIVSRAKINVLSFLKWGGKYLATLAAFTILLVMTVKTGGFGYINARPDAEYLEGAEFQIRYNDFSSNDSDYWYDEEIETPALTAEQADEVMSIIKKHLANGRSNTNPFDVIFGKSTNVSIAVESEKHFDYRPSPKSLFAEKYFRGDIVGYGLNYSQWIYIPDDEARAMMDEISALDYTKKTSDDSEMYDYPDTSEW